MGLVRPRELNKILDLLEAEAKARKKEEREARKRGPRGARGPSLA